MTWEYMASALREAMRHQQNDCGPERFYYIDAKALAGRRLYTTLASGELFNRLRLPIPQPTHAHLKNKDAVGRSIDPKHWNASLKP